MAQSRTITDISSEIRLFGEILDAAETGLIVQSAAANLMANATALRILGMTEDMLLGMPPDATGWRARHADGRPLASGEFPGVQALRTGRPVNDKIFSLEKQPDGQQRWISVSAVPGRGTQTGEPVLYCLIKDISASFQKGEFADRNRAAAQTASNPTDNFLAMLNHEMRTPLNGIMGMLQLALHARSRDSIQEYLTVALESSKHLLILLDDVIETLDSGTKPLHAKEEAAPHSDAAKILVVEDEPINLKTMLLSLQLLGCRAVGADSAYKGLALLRREKFDVVLMDIQMPSLDGIEATRLIRGDTSGALDSNIPIVAITAHTMHGDKERMLEAGMDEYLAKPVYLEQLRAVLSKILKRPLELKSQ